MSAMPSRHKTRALVGIVPALAMALTLGVGQAHAATAKPKLININFSGGASCTKFTKFTPDTVRADAGDFGSDRVSVDIPDPAQPQRGEYNNLTLNLPERSVKVKFTLACERSGVSPKTITRNITVPAGNMNDGDDVTVNLG